ncbi:MAG: amidohydrolase [Oscillospiraceae bacterium]|nr:amidohydrolase [Oscillospiraceae bacterium]
MKDHFSPAKSVFANTVRLRRELHQYPELSEQEHRTRALITARLDELGVPYRIHSNGGITATIGKGNRAVGIRGDIDALPIEEKTGLPYASKNPGVMHACGHDIHTAVLLGAAEMFKAKEDDLGCAVKLFFQPAEETVGGADRMIREGCMEDPKVDTVLGIHVSPTIPVGTVSFQPGKMNAAVIEMDITVRGKGCHGAHPEKGVDAIVVAANIITALQTVDSRRTAPTEPVVVTIGSIQGGTGRNIVAEEVTMKGTVRVLDMDTAKKVKALVTQTATSIASAYGAEALVELVDDYPALVNDRDLTSLMAQEATALLGAEKVFVRDVPSMGADDFAYFANAAKGCYFSIGTLSPGQEGQTLHSSVFAPHEDCMLTGLAVISAAIEKLGEAPL